MGILLTISDLLIPVTVLCIVVFGCLQRMDIYEVFLEGAKEGLQTVLDILPTLIGLMMAVEVMRAGGLGHSGAADSPGGRGSRLSGRAGTVKSGAAGFLLRGNRTSDRPFCEVRPGFLSGQNGLCHDELYGNGVLYDEPVFSFCRDSENEIYAALRPSGKPCRHLCGCGTGAACFLRLDRV